MTDGRRVYNLWFIVCCLLFATVTATAQVKGTVNFTCKKYGFVHPERNEIVGAKTLDSFFNQLYILKTGHKSRLHVLQIGDSHIQADYLSAQIRSNVQHDFGNGGRGVVVPLRVAGSNEPFNYKITSNVVCTSKRCVFVDRPMPIGIGGVTIQSFNENTTFHIKTFDYPPLNYAFNKLTLFYQKDSSAFDFIVEDTLGKKLGIITSTDSATTNTGVVKLPELTNDIVLRAQKTSATQTQATVFGLSLENDSSGVVFSAVGVNGAEAFQYASAMYFAEQTAVLNPALIILSLGTNEAQRRPFDVELTRARIDSLVKQLQVYNPGVPIVLTTPPDSYYGKKYFNPSVAAVHGIMVQYAKENHLAVWDLFSIAGGYKSCYYWKKYGLMRPDGVHFTRKGYEFQGNLFYEALVKAYNNYVGHRHP